MNSAKHKIMLLLGRVIIIKMFLFRTVCMPHGFGYWICVSTDDSIDFRLCERVSEFTCPSSCGQ